MPSSIADFIGTFVQLKQVQNQTEQLQQQARNQAVSGMSTFMEIAKNTADPGELTALVDRFSQLGVGTPEQLGSILQHVTPTVEATKGYLSKLGVDVAAGTATGRSPDEARLAGETASAQNTGMNEGQRATSGFLADIFKKVDTHGAVGEQLAQGLAARTAYGLTPGDMAVDQATTKLPANEVQQGSGVKLGTRMGAAQDAGNQLGWANNRLGVGNLELGNRQLAVTSAYQMGTLEVEAARAAAAAKGHDPQLVDNLLGSKNNILKLIQSTTNPSKQLATGYIGALNGINAQLAALGVPTEGQIAYDPESLVQPGVWNKITTGIQNRLQGGPTPYVVKPTNVIKK
jgi:hypothetical protein